MRKLSALLTVAAAALGLTAVAIAAQTSGLEVKVNPAKAGTAKQSRGVTLDITTTTGDDTGAKPSPGTRAVIRYQKGFKFRGKHFPKCDLAALKKDGPDKCKDAKVGEGSAEVDARPLVPVPIKADVTAFNGEPDAGRDTLYLYSTSQVGTTTLVGILKNDPTGDYGYALDVKVPPLAADATITKFQVKTIDRTVTVNKKALASRRKKKRKKKPSKVKVHYIEAPTFCKGEWKFASEVTYKNGQTLTATDTVACTK